MSIKESFELEELNDERMERGLEAIPRFEPYKRLVAVEAKPCETQRATFDVITIEEEPRRVTVEVVDEQKAEPQSVTAKVEPCDDPRFQAYTEPQRTTPEAAAQDEEAEELLSDLGMLFEMKNHLTKITSMLCEAEYELDYCGIDEYTDDAYSRINKAIQTLDATITDTMAGRDDELSHFKLDTIEEGISAMELYGSDATMREIIICKLRKLTGAQ